VLHSQPAMFALVATILALSGCGSSKTESSSTTATAATTTTQPTSTQTTATGTTPTTGTAIKVQGGKPLSQAAFVARGDAICRSTNSKLNSTTVKAKQDFARLLPQAAAYELVEAQELSRLAPPPSMAADWNKIVASTQALSKDTAKAGAAAQAGNLKAALPFISATAATQKQIIVLAKRDGFKVCSVT
jgi:hypothetical protein